MLIGYARVSTADQDAALQRDVLRREGCERIFEETASGGKVDRPELARVLEQMRQGDTLVVSKLDRLARSMKQLIEIVTALKANGVEFRSLTDSIDSGTAAGQFTFHIFGALAEFERSLIRERTKAGLDAARACGRRGGRPPKLSADDLAVAATLLDSGLGSQTVAERLGVSRATLFRALKAAKQAKARPAPAAVLSDVEFVGIVARLVKGRSTHPFSNRVAVVEAYNIGAAKGLPFGTLDEFKARLAEGAREGLIDLERCDVAGALPKALLDLSRLRLGRDVRHLIVAEGV